MAIVDNEILKPIEWVETLIPNSDELMYFNIRTKSCVSQLPKGMISKPLDRSQWWELWDDSSSRIYYYNVHTKRSSWSRPMECGIGQAIPMNSLQVALRPADVPHSTKKASSSEGYYQEPYRPARVIRPSRRSSLGSISSRRGSTKKRRWQRRNINDLPEVVLSRIFRFIPLHERLLLRPVCKAWLKCLFSSADNTVAVSSPTLLSHDRFGRVFPYLVKQMAAKIKFIDLGKVKLIFGRQEMQFISHHCPSLAVLRAPRCHVALCELPSFRDLKKLSLYGDTGDHIPVSIREDLIHIFNYQLIDIEIYSADNMPCWLIDAIEGPSVTLLHQLEMGERSRDHAQHLFQRCPKIKSFKLKSSFDYNGGLLAPLCQLHSLKTVSLKDCTLNSLSYLHDVLRNSCLLENLILSRTVGNRDFSFLKSLSSLKQLVVPATEFFPLDLKDLHQDAPLEALNLSCTAAAGSAGVNILAQHPCCRMLRSIILNGNMGLTSVDGLLKSCPVLENLSLSNQKRIGNEIFSAILLYGEKLRQLNIKGTGCTKMGLRRFLLERKTKSKQANLLKLNICCDFEIKSDKMARSMITICSPCKPNGHSKMKSSSNAMDGAIVSYRKGLDILSKFKNLLRAPKFRK